MWEWLDDAWSSVSDAASSVQWMDVASSSITTALVGAGVGALAAAVSDGDVSTGLLYGATGGLVAGGLSSFGKQFYDNFEWTDAEQHLDAKDSLTQQELDGLIGVDRGETPTDLPEYTKQGQIGQSFGGKNSFWGPQTTAMALQVGGGMLAGAFKRDTEGEKMDFLKEREQRGREAVRSFAAAKEKRGSFVPGVSVREQAKNKEAIGFSKEEAGVHV